MKKVSIVVPMFNEEEAAPLFFEAIDKVIAGLPNYEFEIVAVNDGSRDTTLDILKSEFEKRNNLVVVSLSRNWGHESAVRAGLLSCTGDCVIPMDADLQDPPEVIPLLLEEWEKGFDVVNAKRSSRKKDSAFKRNTAGLYYKILHSFSKKVKLPQNVANFRLIDRRVLDIINNLPEKERVFRIEVPFVGFKTSEVLFVRPERSKGETKYSLKSMINLAIESFTSLTSKPLLIPMYLAIFFGVIDVLSFLTQLAFLIVNMCQPENALGFKEVIVAWSDMRLWLALNIVTLFLVIILGCFALVGMYLSTTLTEVRGRPTVIVDEVLRK